MPPFLIFSDRPLDNFALFKTELSFKTYKTIKSVFKTRNPIMQACIANSKKKNPRFLVEGL